MKIEHGLQSLQYQCAIQYDVAKDTWDPPLEILKKLSFGQDFSAIYQIYRLRRDFIWGLIIDSDYHRPLVELKIQNMVPSLTYPEFLFEASCFPSKLDASHRKDLVECLETLAKNDEFTAWWETDTRGPLKQPTRLKKQILKDLAALPLYQKENDLQLDDCGVTLSDALSFFKLTRENVENEFKNRLRELQLQYHPDKNSGKDDDFKYLQKCKDTLVEYLMDVDLDQDG